jgi:hypothetical protein
LCPSGQPPGGTHGHAAGGSAAPQPGVSPADVNRTPIVARSVFGQAGYSRPGRARTLAASAKCPECAHLIGEDRGLVESGEVIAADAAPTRPSLAPKPPQRLSVHGDTAMAVAGTHGQEAANRYWHPGRPCEAAGAPTKDPCRQLAADRQRYDVTDVNRAGAEDFGPDAEGDVVLAAQSGQSVQYACVGAA